MFSDRAWRVLRPLIDTAVEALPILHPRHCYYAINVLDVVDCLDLSRTKLTRNEVTGRVSSVQEYHFKPGCVGDRHFFKITETRGLEVLALVVLRRGGL